MPPTTARLFANAFASFQPGLLGREPPRPNPAKPPRPPASQPRRGLRRVDAAAYVGVSPSKFDQMITDGRMPKPIKMDACAVWDMRQLDQAFENLIDQPDTSEVADQVAAAMQAWPTNADRRPSYSSRSL